MNRIHWGKQKSSLITIFVMLERSAIPDCKQDFGLDLLRPEKSPTEAWQTIRLQAYCLLRDRVTRCDLSSSTYIIVELVGTSTESWEDAAENTLKTAPGSIKELRVAEVTKLERWLAMGKHD